MEFIATSRSYSNNTDCYILMAEMAGTDDEVLDGGITQILGAFFPIIR